MQPLSSPILSSLHGQVFHSDGDSRYLLRFEDFWLVLGLHQIDGLCRTLHSMLNCIFRHRHLEEGLLLRSQEGQRRMPLTLETAMELQGLFNDILLVAEGERCATSGATSTFEGPH